MNRVIKIINCTNDESWYAKEIGNTYPVIKPPRWALDENEVKKVYINHADNGVGQAHFVWKVDCEEVKPCENAMPAITE